MSWNLKDLREFELSSILAFRNTLMEGFVKNQRVIHHDDGTSSYSSPLTPDKIKATAHWTNGNPSMGFYRLYLQEDFDTPDQKVFWGMNFTDHYYENPYVTRPQALDFLREAIKAYDYEHDPKKSPHPLRGVNGYADQLYAHHGPYDPAPRPKHNGVLRYDTIVHTPPFNFECFQITETISFYPDQPSTLPRKVHIPISIFKYTAHGGYLNLSNDPK